MKLFFKIPLFISILGFIFVLFASQTDWISLFRLKDMGLILVGTFIFSLLVLLYERTTEKIMKTGILFSFLALLIWVTACFGYTEWREIYPFYFFLTALTGVSGICFLLPVSKIYKSVLLITGVIFCSALGISIVYTSGDGIVLISFVTLFLFSLLSLILSLFTSQKKRS